MPATKSSPTSPIRPRTNSDWRVTHWVQPCTLPRAKFSSRSAQANSVDSSASPAKTISQPGPGSGMRMNAEHDDRRAEHADRDPVGQVEPCVLCEECPEPEALGDLVEHRAVGFLPVRQR